MFDAALVSYVAIMSITPGPNNLMLAASGVNFGFRRSLPHVMGISAGHAVQVALTAALLAYVLAGLGPVRLWLAVVGCLYLLWLSWQIARAGQPASAGRTHGRPMGFLAAALFQWLNPKAWVMVINVALLFMPKAGAGHPGLAVALGISCALINLPCIAVWALAGDRLRRRLATPQALWVFNGLMGGLMAATALWLLFEETGLWPR